MYRIHTFTLDIRIYLRPLKRKLLCSTVRYKGSIFNAFGCTFAFVKVHFFFCRFETVQQLFELEPTIIGTQNLGSTIVRCFAWSLFSILSVVLNRCMIYELLRRWLVIRFSKFVRGCAIEQTQADRMFAAFDIPVGFH